MRCINCGREIEPDGPIEDGEFGHVEAADPSSTFWLDPCPEPSPAP